MAGEEGEEVVCSHCETAVPLEQASMLKKKNSKGLWRYLCPDCVEDIRVPAGYELERDVSFLRGGGSAAEVLGDGAAQATEETGATDPEPTADRSGSSVVADFRGRFVTAEMESDALRPGRVLMNRDRLVLASAADRTTVRLATIHDVVPPEGSDAGGGEAVVVTLAYGGRKDGEMTFIEAPAATVDQFTAVLFRALLGGTAVRFDEHRPDGTRSIHDATLRVHGSRIELEARDSALSIPAAYANATFCRPEWMDRDGYGLAITHGSDGADEGGGSVPITTTVALPTARDRHLLARLLRATSTVEPR